MKVGPRDETEWVESGGLAFALVSWECGKFEVNKGFVSGIEFVLEDVFQNMTPREQR